MIAPKQFIPFTFYCIRRFSLFMWFFHWNWGYLRAPLLCWEYWFRYGYLTKLKPPNDSRHVSNKVNGYNNNNKNNKKNDILSVCTVLTTIYHCREIIPWRCHSDNTKVSTRESTKSIIYRQFLANWNPCYCYCCCRCDSYCKAIKRNPFEMNIRRENRMHAHSVS